MAKGFLKKYVLTNSVPAPFFDVGIAQGLQKKVAKLSEEVRVGYMKTYEARVKYAKSLSLKPDTSFVNQREEEELAEELE